MSKFTKMGMRKREGNSKYTIPMALLSAVVVFSSMMASASAFYAEESIIDIELPFREFIDKIEVEPFPSIPEKIMGKIVESD